MNTQDAKRVLETALICANQPLPLRAMRSLFDDQIGTDTLRSMLDELTFHVDGPKVVAGCNEFTATLRRVDDSSLDGTLGDTWTAHLARK